MKKSLFMILLCGCIIVISACRNDSSQKEITSEDLVVKNIGEESDSKKIEQEDMTDESAGKELVEEGRIIPEQSFLVELNNWGEVNFVSYMPQKDENYEDVSFLLEKNGTIVYHFPYYCENNTTENYIGLFDSVAAVGFRDINNDNLMDVIVIINYVTGAGPQGMLPRPAARIFLADEEGFYLATDLMADIAGNITEKNLSVKSIYEYVEKAADTKEKAEDAVREINSVELSYEEMLDKFYEQFYSGVSDEEIEDRIMKRASFYQASEYYEAATEYWEKVREVTDVANRTEPLYFTDMKYYEKEDFEKIPTEIIHLAKNEIYAKHGYIFKDEDLNNYFMGCAWYQPVINSGKFSNSVFNEYEKYNLDLLDGLDK